MSKKKILARKSLKVVFPNDTKIPLSQRGEAKEFLQLLEEIILEDN